MAHGGDRRGAGARVMAFGIVVAILASACATRPRAATAPATAAAAPVPAEEEGEAASEESDEESAATADGADTTQASGSEATGPCPGDMALVEVSTPSPRRFCIDRYEASLVEVLADGSERPFPHYLPVDGHDVRAVSLPHVFPQGYISEVQAQDACAASSKRLCNFDEWRTACMGPSHTTFPYGEARRPGTCHDTGKSAVIAVFGAKAVAASTPFSAPATTTTPAATGKKAHTTKGRAAQTTRPRATASKTVAKAPGAKATSKKGARKPGKKSARPASVDPGVWARLNDPGLGQVEGALAKTGEHAECVNDFGVFDMMGNIHEWVATDPSVVHGTFAGGYYLDTTLNGDGCLYKTQAHAHEYHDYSTGFRCCAGAAPSR